MEWLKAILEKAKIEDGKLDIDGVMSTVNSEFPKYAVPKNVFNDKVTELKTANKTIEDVEHRKDIRIKGTAFKSRCNRCRLSYLQARRN